MDEDTRLKALNSDEIQEDDVDRNYVLRVRKLLGDYKTDLELWTFLTKNSDTLSNIADMTIYRRSVEVGIEPTVRTTDISEEAFALLKSGDIMTFNARVTEFGFLNLRRANLIGVDLRRANLIGVDLSNANVSEANLRRANLSRANLSNANLSMADLSNANLSRADLSNANLSNA